MFESFARVKGKDVSLGTSTTEYLSEKKLKAKLKSDLSASGFIEKEGKKLRAKKYTGYDFRVSKVDPWRLVQKAGGRFGGSSRLSTGSELWDIKTRAKSSPKKRKKRKSNWLS